jgi:uncharacterized protein YutE (UPF0331/DUF86 family)
VSVATLSKAASIQRAVRRARDEFSAAGTDFANDLTRQDAAVLNVLRACETAIDLAQSLVRERALGVPASSRDVFRLLAEAGYVPPELAGRLQRMVGFRNVAVHGYRDPDPGILASVISCGLDDLVEFS